MKTTKTLGLFAAAATLGLLSTMCGSEAPGPTATTGGSSAQTGGTATTGGTTGGTLTATGGTTGGTAPTTGGTATGGSATGGTATGGSATGGTATGGAGGGGGNAGGGGATTGGNGGAAGAAGAGAGAAGKAGGGAGGASGGGGMSGGGGASGGGGKANGGGGSGGGATTGTFKQVADLLTSKCAGCHKAGQTAIANYTNDDMLYTRLTTPLAGTNKCVGQVLADKTTAANSLLPKAVQGAVTTVAGCDIVRMPKGGMMLSAANIAIITSWIDAGAPQN